MTDDLDTLRPEVRKLIEAMKAECQPFGWATIIAELLRSAGVEAELAAARETIKRLNHRVQVAEAGVAEKVKASAPCTLGRALANAAADKYMHERDMAQAELAALKARIANSCRAYHSSFEHTLAPTTLYARAIGVPGEQTFALVLVED